MPRTRKVTPSAPAITSAQVEMGNSRFSVCCRRLMRWVLPPQLSITVADWVSAAGPAVNETFVSPAPPDIGLMVTHAGTVLWSNDQLSVAFSVMVLVLPPAAKVTYDDETCTSSSSVTLSSSSQLTHVPTVVIAARAIRRYLWSFIDV